MNGKYILGGLLAALIGCTPGEAEFTLKTSEVRKALRGEVAMIRVHETMTTVLSNSGQKVSFGGGKFTNQLDVVKAMAAHVGRNGQFDFSKAGWTNDQIRVWVEENTNALPCVKMDAQLNIALGTANAMCGQDEAGALDALCALQIDQTNGTITECCRTDCKDWDAPCPNGRGRALLNAVLAQGALLDMLFDEKTEGDFLAVAQSMTAIVTPTWFKNLSCVVMGDDDDPLYVVADDAKVNGKLVPHYEGWVRKGERLHLVLDKKKHGRDGGVRFLLEEPKKPEIRR